MRNPERPRPQIPDLKDAKKLRSEARKEWQSDSAKREYSTNFVFRGISRVLYNHGKEKLARRIAADEVVYLRYVDALQVYEEAKMQDALRAAYEAPLHLHFPNEKYKPNALRELTREDITETKPDSTEERQVEEKSINPEPGIIIEPPTPRPVYKPPRSIIHGEKLRVLPDIGEITELMEQHEAKTLEKEKILDPLGVFEHKDRLAAQRLSIFFREVRECSEAILSRLDTENADKLGITKQQIDSFEQFVGAFQNLFMVYPEAKANALETGRKSKIHGTSTIYDPDSNNHGKRGSADNFRYGLPALVSYTVPGSSVRDAFKFNYFPLPYAQYKFGDRLISSLRDVHIEEAKSILYERVRGQDKNADVFDAIEQAKETLITPHLEIEYYRDGNAVSALEAELNNIELNEHIVSELNFHVRDLPDIQCAVEISRRPKRVTADGSTIIDLKPPLQTISEDFAGLRKLKLY